MNFKRLFTAIVSLILVCCLLVNVSPIKAEASSFGLLATIASVPASSVIGAALIGLGVCVGVATTDWDNVVDRAVSYFTEQGAIDTEGNIDIFSLTNAGYQYGISEDILSLLRQWLFANEVIQEESVVVPSGKVLLNGREYPLFPDCEYSYSEIAVISGYLVFCDDFTKQTNYYSGSYATEGDTYYGNTTVYLKGTYTRYMLSGNSWVFYDTGFTDSEWDWDNVGLWWSSVDIPGYGQQPTYYGSDVVYESYSAISLNGDLIAGQIASAADSIAVGYTAWAEKYLDLSVYDPDLPSAVYPIVYSPTYSDVHSLTQEEVWSGVLSGVTLPGEDIDTPTVDTEAISVALGDVTTSTFLNALGDLIETLPLIPPSIEDAIETIPIYIADIRDTIETFPIWQDSLLDHIEQLPIHIGDIRDYIETFPIWQDNILNHIETIPDSLSIAFDDVKVGVKSIADTLTKTLTDVKAIAAERVGVITEAAVGVFVPSEGYIDAKVEALTAKFPVVEDIKKTGEDLKEFALNLGQKPPIIYIDLGAQRGFHNIGGRVPFIDLTWYAEYKPTMDAILSAFLWMWLAWRMFLSVPGIIHGDSGRWERYESHAGKDAASFKSDISTGDNPKYISPFGWSKEEGWHNFPKIRNPNYKRK